MKMDRREFGKLAGVGSLLPWLMPDSLGASRNAPGMDVPNYDRWITGERQAVYEPSDNCWHPQLIRTKSGDLLLSVIVGGKGRTMVLRSQDEGKTWSKPELVASDFDVEGGGGWGMAALASGRIVMSYLDISPWQRLPMWPPASEPRKIGMWPDKGLRPWGWTPRTTKLVLRSVHSDDDGRTWKLSDPIRVTPWLAVIPHGSGPIFEVGDTVYMPVWAWLSEDDWGNCALLESKDGGLTWAPGNVIARADKSRQVECLRELRRIRLCPVDKRPPPVNVRDRTLIGAQPVVRADWSLVVQRPLIPTQEQRRLQPGLVLHYRLAPLGRVRVL